MRLQALHGKSGEGPAGSGLGAFLTDLACDLAGTGIFAVGIHVFTAPNEIAPGGVSGLATLLQLVTGLPIGAGILLLNLPLLLLAWRFLGLRFTCRTLRTVLILSVMTDFVVKPLPVYQGNQLLAALYGGILMGVGLAVVFLRGSTTGGGDIAGKLIQLRFPHLQLGRALFAFDLMVLLLAYLVYGELEPPLYALISIYACSRMIDTILYGLDTGRMAWIFSEKAPEIAAAILEQLDRGATFFYSRGAYSGQDRPALVCAVRRAQYPRLKRIVGELDSSAFLIVTEASEITGHGFRPHQPHQTHQPHQPPQ